MAVVAVAAAALSFVAPGAELAFNRAPLLHATPAHVGRHAVSPLAQQGPLEEGFKELMPMATEDGNVDPELVDRVDAEVFELTGVGLADLLNPSKVVNYEREVILLGQQIAECNEPDAREELEARLSKVSKQLYSEKRTVFAGWLKNLFVGQAAIAVVLGGISAFDVWPWFTIDLSLRALGFWSFWLFIIPSLRARRPKGWEKVALDIAFLGSPIITIGAPFVTKDPGAIWAANLALLAGCYGYGYAFGRGDNAVELTSGKFSGYLNAIDFGSGQERGIRGTARERLFAQQEAEREAERQASSQAAAGGVEEKQEVGGVEK